MKKIRWPIALMVVTVLALALPLVASANNSWGGYPGYHWASDVSQIELSLGKNISSAWEPHLKQADADWNLSAVFENTLDPGRTNPKRCNPDSGLVEICSSKYGFNGWLGIAGIWISGEHITKGYVKLNDSYFNTATYNTPEWRQMVMCQEIGHDFGLDHQDVDFYNTNLGTCMDYTSNPASNQHPDDHDYQQLVDKYAQLDGFRTWADAPVDDGSDGGNGKGNNGKGKKGEPPGQEISQWGKAIGTDGNGRPNQFELDLGNGNKLITHVLWAD